MADLIDVLTAIKTVALATLYPPDGTVPPGDLSPVAGCAVLAVTEPPAADDLDAVAASLGAGQTPRVIIAVSTMPGMMRNTTRFPQTWQRQLAGPTTLTVSVDDTGTVATIGGSAPGVSGPPQNIALVLRFGGSGTRAFVYPVGDADTLDSIAASLAALVAAATPATAAGPAVTIPAAFGLLGRVGGISTMLKPLMQQIERVQVVVWGPAGAPLEPQLRDLVAAPIKVAIAGMRFLPLPDGTGARIITRGDRPHIDPEKAGLFCRSLYYDVEYSTTVTMPAPQVVAPASMLQGGAPPIVSFTEDDPPVITVEA